MIKFNNSVYCLLLSSVSMIILLSTVSYAQEVPEIDPNESRLLLTIDEPNGNGTDIPDEQFNESQSDILLVKENNDRNMGDPMATPLPQQLFELPDIIPITIGYHSRDLEDLLAAGLIQPVDEFFESMGITFDDMPPYMEEAITDDGHIWAVPNQAGVWLLAYSKAAFKEAGLEPSFDSWEELFEVADKVSKLAYMKHLKEAIASAEQTAEMLQTSLNSNEIESISLPTSISIPKRPPFRAPASNQALWSVLYMLETTGWKMTPTVPSEIDYLNDPNLQKAFTLWLDYKSKGVIDENNWFGMSGQSTPVIGTDLSANEIADGGEDYGVMRPPSKLFKDDPTGDELRKYPAQLRAYAVKKNPQAKLDAAYTFLKWLISEEGQLTLVNMSLEKQTRTFHVPLYKHILESDAFKQILADHPDYEIAAGEIQHAFYPRPGELAQLSKDVANQASGNVNTGLQEGEELRMVLYNAYENAKKSVEEQNPLLVGTEDPEKIGDFSDM